MEFTQLSEEEQQAISAPPAPPLPSKEDLLRQIEADYLVAQRDNNTEEMAKLDDRHAVVKAASTDQAANDAYSEHCSPTEALAPVSPSAPVTEDGNDGD